MEKQKYEVLTDVLENDEFFYDELMSRHTSFKIGGPVDLLLLPKSVASLVKIVKICKNRDFKFYIVGNGSNLLVSDEGISGIVIKISKNLNQVNIEDGTVYAESGVLLSSLSKGIYNHSLKGFEFASGIPGTLGGAIYMNAGAYGGEMKDVLVEAQVIDYNGEVKTLNSEALELSYRNSILQREELIAVSAILKLEQGDKIEIKALMDDLTVRRKTKQPIEKPSAGSTFKRPEGYYAGKLIMDSGLMGKSIGGAMVSTKHAGFIVNEGNATCEDVLALIKYVQDTVYEKYGVHLETEVRRLGF